MGQSLNMDEARLFVLYWLEFFGCPMTSDGLNILWARRKGAANLKQGRLPIAELASAGYVAYGKKGLVSLVPRRLSVENFREVWAASKPGDGRLTTNFSWGAGARRRSSRLAEIGTSVPMNRSMTPSADTSCVVGDCPQH